MILAVSDLLTMTEFSGQSETVLQARLDAIERLIRSYTHNNFQNRFVRFEAASEGDTLLGTSAFIKEGDTVQISRSMVNDGLYTVAEIADEYIRVDSELFTVPVNLVTKVEYPADVKMGVLNLMIWEVKNRKNVGIKSESLSRHNVTYYDQDANNSIMGYPVSLIGFLQPYKKARF